MEFKHFCILIVAFSLSLAILYTFAERQSFYEEKIRTKHNQASIMFPYIANANHILHEPDIFEFRMRTRRKILQEKCAEYGLDVPGNDSLHRPNSWEYLVNEKHHIIWCNVFKSASSSWMYNFNILAGYSPEFLKKSKIVPLTLARKKYPRVSLEELQMAQKTSLTFMIVRHPFERLLSAYKDKFMFALPRTYHSKLDREIINAYRKTKRNSPQYPTFSEFVRWHLDQIRTNSNIDIHLVPTTKFCTPCLIHIDIVMKFETLQEDQVYFIKKADLQRIIAASWQNKGKGIKTSDILDTYYSQLTLEQLKGLYEYYKYDFKLFGYNATQYFDSVQET